MVKKNGGLQVINASFNKTGTKTIHSGRFDLLWLDFNILYSDFLIFGNIFLTIKSARNSGAQSLRCTRECVSSLRGLARALGWQRSCKNLQKDVRLGLILRKFQQPSLIFLCLKSISRIKPKFSDQIIRMVTLLAVTLLLMSCGSLCMTNSQTQKVRKWKNKVS